MRKPVEVFFACVIALGAALPAAAQPNLITCILTSEVPLLRLESQAELIGEIQFVCTGGDPNTVRFVNFELYLATTISSDITGPDPDGTEALLLIDDPLPGVVNTSNGMTYNGQVKGTPGVAPGFGGGPGAQDSGNVYQGFRVPGFDNRLSWNGIPFVPAPLGSVRIIRFLNVRADMTQFTVPPNTPVTITAALSANPPNAVQLGGPWLDVGRVVPSMTVSVANEAGAFQLRFEETFAAAFKKRIENTAAGALTSRQQGTPGFAYFTESEFTPEASGLDIDAPGVADSGTRLVARLTDIPDGVFFTAPSSVTSAVPFNPPGVLELRRVLDFEADYSGGLLMASGEATELIPVVGRQATLLYEVVALPPFDGVHGAFTVDRFSIPLRAIYGLPTTLGGAAVTLSYAPLYRSGTMSSLAPEPRFHNATVDDKVFPIAESPSTDYVTFLYIRGDPVPLLQDVNFDAGDPVISSTITVLPQTGGDWLSAVAQSEATTETVTIAANPTGFAQGTYHGAITLRRQATVNELTVLPVILTVLPPPELLVDTSPLVFHAFAGGPAPAPEIVYVTASSRAVEFTVAASTSSGGGWLLVNSSRGFTSANLAVSANPAGLAPGTYEGAISIRAEDAVNSPRIVPITLVVGPAPPSFEAIGAVNAASYQDGGVAAGEIVTFFGVRIGPVQPAGLELDQFGRVSSLVAGTRIFFDGVPAPLIAVGWNQSSCVVPYSVAGRATTVVEIELEGNRSQPVTLAVVPARPGIFTADSSGAGQGAILNQDSTLNSPANPAAPGSVVVIYLTGEGQTAPPGVDGKLNDPANLPAPLLPVSVRIGGIDSTVEFAGGAPGMVAGVLQVNARIDPGVAPGPAVPVEIIIGGVRTQPGVTLAVQ